MAENQWKKPKDIGRELQWKNGFNWRDVYFQVSASTIHLYSKNRKDSSQLLNEMSFTKVDEISEIGTKFSKRCFKIVLKTGVIEQFKCPDMDSLQVQKWIDNLRHAMKFWTDKENLQQLRKGRQRRITLEGPDEASECLNGKKHRVFFTLWDEEMIGLLVNATSTFTDVFPRLFSCQPSSCSVCKIRHLCCDLWAVDTTGTARRVEKDEILTNLDKAGNGLFVMEHHQKLLVVHFSDFSYEIVPAPAAITAKEVLKLEQIASKLKELSCFDPGLFLSKEGGEELQFCMNDNPFKYHESGKIIARSKCILMNSVKMSDYRTIAKLRCDEWLESLRKAKASKVLADSLADQILKSCSVDEELCFIDDHFALHNNAREPTIANHREMQARPDPIPMVDEGYQWVDFYDKSGGNDGHGDRHCKTHAFDSTQYISTCSHSTTVKQLPGDGVRESSENVTSGTPNNADAKNRTDVVDSTLRADDIASINLPNCNDDDSDIKGKPNSIDCGCGEYDRDETSLSASTVDIRNDSPDERDDIKNGNVIRTSFSDGTVSKNGEDTVVPCANPKDVSGMPDGSLIAGSPSPDANLPTYTANGTCAKNKNDDAVVNQRDDNVVENNHDDTNFPSSNGATINNDDSLDRTFRSYAHEFHDISNENVMDAARDPCSNICATTTPHGGYDEATNVASPSESCDNKKMNLTDHVHTSSTELSVERRCVPSQTDIQVPYRTRSLGHHPGRCLIHSQSDRSMFRKQREKCRELDIHSHESRRGIRRRTLSDLNIRYSFSTTTVRKSRTKSESELLDTPDDVLRVKDVILDDSEESLDDVFKPTPVSTFTGPTWSFAKRVEKAVQKILEVRDDSKKVERMIAQDLCKVLYELLHHDFKKNFLVSFFSFGSSVWNVCQVVCKITNIAVHVIEKIKAGSNEEKFHLFIRECIRKKILSRWFEMLTTERVQKKIMEYYEPSAVVLEPEHSKAMEHLKLHLDRLDVLKLKEIKTPKSTQPKAFLYNFEC